MALPAVNFIEDVEKFCEGHNVDDLIAELNRGFQGFRMLEQSLVQKKARLLQKIPEIKRTLEVVNLLIQRRDDGEETTTEFQLADQLYAKAKIASPSTVNLWLGANVMVEYKLEEARDLLIKNLENANKNLETVNKDLDYVKDQITITEVSVARLYNYDVKRRREAKGKMIN